MPIKVSQAIRFANKRITSNKMSETEQDGKAHSRLGLAIVPLCHGTGAPFDEHRRPLAPSKLFDLCVTEKNSIIAVAPCLRP